MTISTRSNPFQLHRFLTEVPSEMEKSHGCKSTIYSIAMIVSAIGALAIFGGISAIYLGLMTQASLSGFEMVVVILTACSFSHGVDVFSKWQIIESHSAKWYKKLDMQFQKIRHWNNSAIQSFYAVRGKSISEIQPSNLCLMRQINAAHPLKTLLPLLARCQILEHCIDKWGRKERAQNTALQNLTTLPRTNQANISKIHSALSLRAKEEKKRFEKLHLSCLHLLINPSAIE